MLTNKQMMVATGMVAAVATGFALSPFDAYLTFLSSIPIALAMGRWRLGRQRRPVPEAWFEGRTR